MTKMIKDVTLTVFNGDEVIDSMNLDLKTDAISERPTPRIPLSVADPKILTDEAWLDSESFLAPKLKTKTIVLTTTDIEKRGE